MKKNKILSLLLAISLTFTMVLSLASCGGNPPPEEPECTQHKDENADGKCDACLRDYDPVCTEHYDNNNNDVCDNCGAWIDDVTVATVVVTVSDEVGNPMSDVRVVFTRDGSEVAEYSTLYTNEQGSVSLTVEVGTYTVAADSETVPSGYISIPRTLEITETTGTIALETINNIPDGTESRPFPLTSEDDDEILLVDFITIPANTEYYYIVYHPSMRTITLSNDDIYVYYHNQQLTAQDGSYSWQFTENGSNAHSTFKIANPTDVAITVPVDLAARLGDLSNPIILDDLTNIPDVEVAAGTTVYLQYTVDWTRWIEFTINSPEDAIVTVSWDDDAKLTIGKNTHYNEDTEQFETVLSGIVDVTEGTVLTISVSFADDSLSGTVQLSAMGIIIF